MQEKCVHLTSAMSAPYNISKTSFIKFEQCEKAFFLYKNHPYLRDKPDADRLITFQRGHDVGTFAQQLFPGGRDVSKETNSAAQALELTSRLLEEKTPVIYEATLVYNGVLVMLDILTLGPEGYTAYEVKSSLKVSETYIKDACLQYYVLKHIVGPPHDFFLVTINGDYRLAGESDPRQLFKKRSIKVQAEDNLSFFAQRLQTAHELLEKNAIPDIAVGRHCFRPYQCDFFGSCWKNTLSDRSIFNLPLVSRDKLFELHGAGLRHIDELGDHHLEKKHLLRIRDAFVTNAAVIDTGNIKRVLQAVKEPAAAMDMEVWNPAIPQLQGTRPFEQIPFLVCFYDGNAQHHFFSAHETDQRRSFAEALIALAAPYASILVYDKTMELIVIDNLAVRFSDLKPDLESIKNRVVDVFEVFLNLYYYDPAFKSNFSLKTVTSQLLSDINYSSIGSGLEAMNYYSRFRAAAPGFEKEELKQELVDYCGTDCKATLGVAKFLSRLVGE